MTVYKASCKVEDTSTGRTVQANCTLEQRGRKNDWKLTICFHGVGRKATLEHLYKDMAPEEAKAEVSNSVKALAATHFVLNCRESAIEMTELIWKQG